MQCGTVAMWHCDVDHQHHFLPVCVILKMAKEVVMEASGFMWWLTITYSLDYS